MEDSKLIELCYEIIPNENKKISVEKWNSIFPRLMSLENVHTLSAMPKGDNIELIIGYKYSKDSFAQTIKMIENKLEDSEYQICFTQANYVHE
jgi:uncharacterized protein YecA (UPF0149 family)